MHTTISRYLSLHPGRRSAGCRWFQWHRLVCSLPRAPSPLKDARPPPLVSPHNWPRPTTHTRSKKCFKKRHANATQTWRSDRSSLMCQTFFRDRNSCNENSYMLHQWPEIYNSMRLLNETGMSCWHTRSWWHIAQATAKQHSFSLIIFGPISNPWCCQHMGQSITPMTDFWPHIILQRCFWTHICKDLPHVFQQLF